METAPDPAFVRLVGDDTVVIKNRNTTIGYATFDAAACELSYIFVSPAFRFTWINVLEGHNQASAVPHSFVLVIAVGSMNQMF